MIYFKVNSTDLQINGFCNFDFVSDAEDRKSVTGFEFMMSEELYLGDIKKKQQIIALSTTDADVTNNFDRNVVDSVIILMTFQSPRLEYILLLWNYWKTRFQR